MSKLSFLKKIGFAEGLSFLIILFITMPLKYIWGIKGANYYTGMIHGVLFILYILWVIMVGIEREWSKKAIFLSLLASIIPFGTFWADKKFFK
jgi:integral membrane protein